MKIISFNKAANILGISELAISYLVQNKELEEYVSSDKSYVSEAELYKYRENHRQHLQRYFDARCEDMPAIIRLSFLLTKRRNHKKKEGE